MHDGTSLDREIHRKPAEHAGRVKMRNNIYSSSRSNVHNSLQCQTHSS